MKNSNSAIIKELKFVQKRVNRLSESFRLEKEKVLENPDIGKLEKLRQRSRVVYQMKLAEYSRDIGRLKRCISLDQSGMEEADDLAELCRYESASLLAHLVSTPNRLIRIYKSRDSENRTNVP